MSIRLMADIWDKCEALKGPKLLVMLAMADFANDDGLCWPSVPTIAKKVRKSERQTSRIIDDLVDSGYLTIAEKGNGRGKSTRYIVSTKGDIQGKSTEIKGDIQGQNNSEKDDIEGKKGDIQRVKGDTAMSPDPPIEPPTEPSIENQPRDAAAVAKIKNLYKRNIGLMTPIMLDKIAVAVDSYPPFWIEEAIAIAGEAEGSKRSWNYIAGILRNSADAGMSPYQRQQSRVDDSRMQRHSAGHPERYEIPDELADIIIG